MTELIKISLLFLLGIVAGFINVMAGGGSTLTLPMLIFLGLDGAVANGTNRVAILVQNLSAVLSFKQENFSQFKTSLKLAAFTLPGAIIGALVAVSISNDLFKKILGMIIIGVVITMVVPRAKKDFGSETGNYKPYLLYPALFGVGFYGGFIQAGVGFLIMATLHYLMKLNLVRVNMHKVFIIFIYTIPALLIFILTKNIDWIFGIVLAGGMAFGGWWSAKLAVKRGEKVVRIVLMLAMLIMALKLLKII
ncbi:MAG: sulfite exporter TauE/SafE family protein [Calditrichaeota bacterium]|nr:sulfite exporter TauE/SafE family protein [Calditrichota bacterium]